MIVGDAKFEVQDRWGKGLPIYEAVVPVINEAVTAAAVVSIVKELLEEIL